MTKKQTWWEKLKQKLWKWSYILHEIAENL